MARHETLIFIPTYNERSNVEKICHQILALDIDADILFLDDNSPDGTGAVLDQLAQRFPQVFVAHRAMKTGIGSAHLAGIAYAYDRDYRTLITLDSDFSHTPSDIMRLLQAYAEDVHIVIGSRYLQHDSLREWNLFRKSLTRFGHTLTSTLLRMPYDATGAFRLYDLKKIHRGIFSLIKSNSYPFFFESLFILHRNGCPVREIPIFLPSRVYGSSKLTFKEAISSGLFLLKLFMQNLAAPNEFKRERSIDVLRPQLSDTQGWDGYWDHKRNGANIVYDILAAICRQVFIKGNLCHFLNRHFRPGSCLLHAGCGGGQSDTRLHDYLRITAIDISPRALNLYARNNPKVYRLEQADIFHLPFPDRSFDGVFNMGVLEHFTKNQIASILNELGRVLKVGGKMVLFWPHRMSMSVLFLKWARKLYRIISQRDIRFHPSELTYIASKSQAETLLQSCSFSLIDYYFGPRDLFVQAVVVASKDNLDVELISE